MFDFLIVLGCVVLFLFTVEAIGESIESSNAEHAFRGWASPKGYEIVKIRRCWVNTGPFIQKNPRTSPVVYKLLIANGRGQKRPAWGIHRTYRYQIKKLRPYEDPVIVVWDAQYRLGYWKEI